MTQELKDKALDILGRCTVKDNKVTLPAETIDTEVWSIVREALNQAGGKYRKATNVFVFNPYVNQLEAATAWLTDQPIISYEAPQLYDGPVTIEAEAEEEQSAKKETKQLVKERRTLRYDFSASEIHDLALQLAQTNAKMTAVEEEKGQQASHYSAILKEVKATLNRISILITNGFENRDVDVEIYYNKPEPGKKTIIRLDNNTSHVEKMEYFEFNLFTQPVDEEVGAEA